MAAYQTTLTLRTRGQGAQEISSDSSERTMDHLTAGLDRRQFVKSAFMLMAGAGLMRPMVLGGTTGPSRLPLGGPFVANWESLKAYRAPEWFRDAKFGITAQWTPQSVPEQGDWYAHNMYVQGSQQYAHHVANYGHPSKTGYKDLCRLWRGEKWDPEAMVGRYKRAGARYVVVLANHHDGFDCWDSRHQPWNSVNIGPGKDIVGGWAQAVRAQGLRFGVSVFSPQNWQWFNVSHGSDATGPLQGVPYDGNLTRADGAGQWWEGYDPRALYGPPHPDGHPPSEEYIENFVARTRDLIDRYDPDQIFFTERGLPFGDTGLRLAAYYYNENLRRHGGEVEAVVNTKAVPPDLRGAIVSDRLPDDGLDPHPWQMDICIGDWHYQRGLRYKTAGDVLPYLVDIVSKNGNLLLNLPIRADGTLDEEEEAILGEITRWMDVNGEAIFDTRPWKICGEGPTPTQPVDFPYRTLTYTAADIRFTTKGGLLYAIALAWPVDGRLEIKSLGRSGAHWAGGIAAVELLGGTEKLGWTQEDERLVIRLPDRKPSEYCHAIRIRPASVGQF